MGGQGACVCVTGESEACVGLGVLSLNSIRFPILWVLLRPKKVPATVLARAAFVAVLRLNVAALWKQLEVSVLCVHRTAAGSALLANDPHARGTEHKVSGFWPYMQSTMSCVHCPVFLPCAWLPPPALFRQDFCSLGAILWRNYQGFLFGVLSVQC